MCAESGGTGPVCPVASVARWAVLWRVFWSSGYTTGVVRRAALWRGFWSAGAGPVPFWASGGWGIGVVNSLRTKVIMITEYELGEI